jgi:hypothetical protein
MKVIGNLPIVKDIDAKYPFGATIQNETDTNDGTPVIREIYGDILMNLYKIMQLAGITPNDLEDNSDTQFQLVDAFKKFSNEINDVNHVLELNGNVWSLPLNLAILPNKFVCFAQVTDNYVSTESYTFKGTGTLEVPFNSTGFNASEQVLIVIESTGVKAFSLEKLQEVADTVYTPLGSPIAFNDTDKMYYKEEGYLISDLPSSSDLQQLIRVFASDGTLVLNDVFVQNGKVICVVFIPAESEYGIYDLSLDLTSISLNITFGSGTDYFPYFYLDLEGNLFVTNSGNDEIDDFLINKYSRDVIGNFVSISTTTIEADFEKTTNAVIHNGFIYTFVNGYLRKYNLTTGIKTDVMYLPSVNGQLFRFNGEVYFTTGEIAKKWFLS